MKVLVDTSQSTGFRGRGADAAVYESAAQAFNTCRANGVHGSNTDFLICSVSLHHQLPIFSTDDDFLMYRRWLPLHLYAP